MRPGWRVIKRGEVRGGGSEGGKVREEGCGCQRRECALKGVGYEVEVREVMVRVG